MTAAAKLPPSLYADTARSAPPTPPLDQDRRTAVAIIGGGFTGLSAALHLAEQAVDVVVLEANEPGWGASGRNGGQVNPGLKHDPDQIERDFGSDLGARMIALSGAAPDFVFNLIRRHQIACGALQSGTLRSAITSSGGAQVRSSTEQWIRRSAPVRLLNRVEIQAATGTSRYQAAMLDPRGGQLNPLSYARGLAQAAMRQGAIIHGGTKVLHASKTGTSWCLQTQSGSVTADKTDPGHQWLYRRPVARVAAQPRAVVQRDRRKREAAGRCGSIDYARALIVV